MHVDLKMSSESWNATVSNHDNYVVLITIIFPSHHPMGGGGFDEKLRKLARENILHFISFITSSTSIYTHEH